ncbi:MAG: hypothetical protein WB439_14320 [Acidobacteriaceae bacterium]
MFDKVSAIMRPLNTPIRRCSPVTRLLVGLVAVLCCLCCALYFVAHQESVFIAGDARFYLGIATGDYSEVMQPFASRQLGAIVAAVLARLLHCAVEQGFVLEGIGSLIVMLVAVYSLILRTSAPRWMLFAIALVPFWALLLEDLVLPDLWYSALLAVVLLLLAGEHFLSAALMMFPLMLSRESTSLTLVCFLVAAWGWLRWRDRIVAVVSAAAGSVVVSHLASRARPNAEGIPESLYMIAKVPWNFMNNVLGQVPWSNVNSQFCSVPKWKMQIHLGAVRAIGICGFSSLGWMKISEAILSDFGLLPLLLCFIWWRTRKLAVRSVLLRFCLIYGGASLLLAPVLGTWFTRLIGYAWPIFFVAVPLLFDRISVNVTTTSRNLAAIGFFGMHLLVFYLSGRGSWVTQLSVDALLWTCGFFLLKYWLSESEPLIDGSDFSQHGAIPSA